MQAARLASKYRTVRDLKIGPATIYRLAGAADADLPDILKELAKHPIKDRFEADRLIHIGRSRKHYPSQKLPDETLWRLGTLHGSTDAPSKKLIAALLEHKPETNIALIKLEKEVLKQHQAEQEAKAEASLKKEQDAEKEAEALLDGSPPALPPPPITPPEPQTIGVDPDDDLSAEAETFQNAIYLLQDLRAKPLSKFTDVCTPKRLQEVIDFLSAVLAKLKTPAA
jgi:hypothetical protein